MVAKVISNRSAYFKGGADGIGISNQPDGIISWVGAVGKAGDVAYFTAASCTSNNKLFQGYAFQSTGGCTVDFTLQNAGLAANPDPAVQASVKWANTLTVPADTIVQPTINLFSCIRVTWTEAGEFYVVSH